MKDRFLPGVADWQSHVDWVKGGKTDLVTRAREKVEKILATHKPAPLTPEQEKAIDAVLDEARAYYREAGLISADQWGPYMEALSLRP